ncbi:MAG: glycoside hydrolase family 3 N-terminal domain-containing protein, partial [Chitinophagaceae bacterium]
MKQGSLFIALLFIVSLVSAQQSREAQMNLFVESLLKKMTLEEKVGQLNQYNGDLAFTGPVTMDKDKIGQIRRGMVGSMLNVTGVEHTRELQKIALQSRLKIPMLFGQDVIHGFRTTFPIPLAEAASWDLEAIELSARIAAIEASAAGVHWTFAPMVDISRDPRWGRVMEGAGEDTYLGSLIARARVKGFQGKGLGYTDAV